MAAVSGLLVGEKRLLIEVEVLSERDEAGRTDPISMDLGRGLLLDRVDSSPFCFLVGEVPSSRLVRVNARLRGRDRDRLDSFASSPSRVRGLSLPRSFFSASAVVGVYEEVDDPLPPRWFWINFCFMLISRPRI